MVVCVLHFQMHEWRAFNTIHEGRTFLRRKIHKSVLKKICINHILSVNRPGCVVIVAEILVFGIVETGHLTGKCTF